jgi:adenosylhomocysteine nucleosidase
MSAPFSLFPAGAKTILFAMAAEAEYGPNLRERLAPLITGVGPVEAAVSLTAALSLLRAEGALPHLVVSLGSAGSKRLEQCGVYQVSSVAYRDMDASPLGFEKGRTPFLDLPKTLDLPHLIPGIPSASLSTGANIVSGAAYDGIEEDMVDMETYALLRACHKFGVPLIGLRGISDGKAPLSGFADWTEYLHVIDERLADAVDLLLTRLASGRLETRQAGSS